MIVKSYAKINLSLKIKSRLENGYHDLEMINLPIDLHDVIEIETNPQFVDTYITCDDIRLMSLRSNLVTKAVDKMREVFGFKQHFLIHIHKEVPFAAGLGGGSSNAAVTMLALNKMLKLGATYEQLCKIGKELGSDIPFFLDPHPAFVEGIGEKLTPIKMKNPFFCLIIKPTKGLSTKDVYEACDNFPREEIDTAKVIEGLAVGDESLISKYKGNDLQAPAISMVPEIQGVLDKLKSLGFIIYGMTGSGSSCYGLTMNHKLIREAERAFANWDCDVLPCKTML